MCPLSPDNVHFVTDSEHPRELVESLLSAARTVMQPEAAWLRKQCHVSSETWVLCKHQGGECFGPKWNGGEACSSQPREKHRGSVGMCTDVCAPV